jgi:hypothetical protein
LRLGVPLLFLAMGLGNLGWLTWLVGPRLQGQRVGVLGIRESSRRVLTSAWYDGTRGLVVRDIRREGQTWDSSIDS